MELKKKKRIYTAISVISIIGLFSFYGYKENKKQEVREKKYIFVDHDKNLRIEAIDSFCFKGDSMWLLKTTQRENSYLQIVKK